MSIVISMEGYSFKFPVTNLYSYFKDDLIGSIVEVTGKTKPFLHNGMPVLIEKYDIYAGDKGMDLDRTVDAFIYRIQDELDTKRYDGVPEEEQKQELREHMCEMLSDCSKVTLSEEVIMETFAECMAEVKIHSIIYS